jgi:hypothetical protein
MPADTLLARAGELLAENTREAVFNGRVYRFSIPAQERYRFQWFWDSCFHAIVWARLDVERACDELRGLLALQAPSGRIPHVVFWDETLVSRTGWHYLESPGRLGWFLPGSQPRATAMIQPPVIAQAVEAIVERGGEAFLDEALPALERYYRYLARERDPDGDGLISIIAQFESGIDFSPAYDPKWGATAPAILGLAARVPEIVDKLVDWNLELVFRFNPRHVEDVLVNSVYADALQALARLAARRGNAQLEEWATATGRRVLDALLERCYDERRGLFFNLNGAKERRADGVKTIISLLPLLLADLPSDVAARLVEHLADPREFWAPFPVASVALDEPTFRRDSRVDGSRRIWRGPCSLNTNWLLSLGLRRHGENVLADDLAARSRELVERGGFNEFFDPLDGTPVGAHRFGWATLAAVI